MIISNTITGHKLNRKILWLSTRSYTVKNTSKKKNIYIYIVQGHSQTIYTAVADTEGLQWFQLETPLKERAPLIRDDWYREEQKSP